MGVRTVFASCPVALGLRLLGKLGAVLGGRGGTAARWRVEGLRFLLFCVVELILYEDERRDVCDDRCKGGGSSGNAEDSD